jgi:hypothetical protein
MLPSIKHEAGKHNRQGRGKNPHFTHPHGISRLNQARVIEPLRKENLGGGTALRTLLRCE